MDPREFLESARNMGPQVSRHLAECATHPSCILEFPGSSTLVASFYRSALEGYVRVRTVTLMADREVNALFPRLVAKALYTGLVDRGFVEKVAK